jgi:hypothetical protein
VLLNVKGTCNNVATGFLPGRSRDRGIPEVIVRSVQHLRTDRSADVMVNDFTSEVENLPQSGPPQKSTLAPILFPFFNADLVQSQIRDGGCMTSIDEYTAWVVGILAERNTRKIQRNILPVLPVLQKWEKESGVIVEASTTTDVALACDYISFRMSSLYLHQYGKVSTYRAHNKLPSIRLLCKDMQLGNDITRNAKERHQKAVVTNERVHLPSCLLCVLCVLVS